MAGGCEYVYYQFKNIFDFVKDKDNSLSYNIWSGTDYLHNVNGFVKGAGISYESSNEWCVNGNYSLKATNSSEGSAWWGILYTAPLYGKSLQISGVIKTSINRETNIRVNERDSNNSNIQTVSLNIPKNSMQKFNISLNTGNACENILIQLISYDAVGTSIYLDAISLNIQ